jgi:type VI protein secretion system component VasF
MTWSEVLRSRQAQEAAMPGRTKPKPSGRESRGETYMNTIIALVFIVVMVVFFMWFGLPHLERLQ